MSVTSTSSTISSRPVASVADRRAHASIALGRARGYYRLMFDAGPVDAPTFAGLAGVPLSDARAWLDEQFAAGVLRVVDAAAVNRRELLLPGEYVPILLDDHGEAEFAGARALLDAHRDALPPALDEWEDFSVNLPRPV